MKWIIIALALLSATAQAKGLNKCIINGKTVYRQLDCPEGSKASFSGGTFSSLDTSGLAKLAEEDRIQEEKEKQIRDMQKRQAIAAENRQIQNAQQYAIQNETNRRLRQIQIQTNSIRLEQQHREITGR